MDESVNFAPKADEADKTIEIEECEQIILPALETVVNGETTVPHILDVDFVEESDPMADIEIEQEEKGENDASADIEELDEDMHQELEEAEYENEDADDQQMTEEFEINETNAKISKLQATNKESAKIFSKKSMKAKSSTVSKNGLQEQDEAHISSEEKILPEDDEKPTSSSSTSIQRKENEVEEEQCRVCTAKDDLVSLFKTIEQLTVAEMLMTICPTVNIARKDFMPQYICNPCLDNVTIAVQLKKQCECTESELRKKLSRSKNKVRRPYGSYVIIDAPIESEPSENEEEPNDDVEFKVSEEEESASADDDDDDDTEDDSDYSEKKRKAAKTAGSRRGRRKSVAATNSKLKAKRNSDSDGNDDSSMAAKKRKTSAAAKDEQPESFPCDECDQVFKRKLSLVLHKKSHSNRADPIECNVCGKVFKIKGAYRTHMQKHQQEPTGIQCGKCNKVFVSKVDWRHHLTEEHEEPKSLHVCEKCKRPFVSVSRLMKHKESRCPGTEIGSKPRKFEFEGYTHGRDLFKSVAPLTTTYWSDSFSD